MSAKGPKHAQPSPISIDEHRARVATAQERMAEERLDALFITSEDNFRYLTGFNGPVWHNPTRPRYLVVPRAGDPIVIVPTNHAATAARTVSWIKDVRTWIAPAPEDDGVSLAVEALEECTGQFNRVGAELGPESRMTMPIGDFLRIKQGIAPAEVVDGEWMVMKMRMIKSPAEVALIRHVCQLVSDAFEALPGVLTVGDSEWVAAAKFQAEVLKRGGERIDYLICTSARGGYVNNSLGPTDRVLKKGDVLVIDTGVCCEGYFCDFDRAYAFGSPADEVTRAYETAWRATEAGIAAARPGARTADVWRAQAEVIAEANGTPLVKEGFGAGRLGHGLGLRMCEPPSNSPDDGTVIEPGIVITIEPGTRYDVQGKKGHEQRVLVHEEDVHVTADGAELLTRRAAREIPVID